jgi:hypothetical protein
MKPDLTLSRLSAALARRQEGDAPIKVRPRPYDPMEPATPTSPRCGRTRQDASASPTASRSSTAHEVGGEDLHGAGRGWLAALTARMVRAKARGALVRQVVPGHEVITSVPEAEGGHRAGKPFRFARPLPGGDGPRSSFLTPAEQARPRADIPQDEEGGGGLSGRRRGPDMLGHLAPSLPRNPWTGPTALRSDFTACRRAALRTAAAHGEAWGSRGAVFRACSACGATCAPVPGADDALREVFLQPVPPLGEASLFSILAGACRMP